MLGHKLWASSALALGLFICTSLLWSGPSVAWAGPEARAAKRAEIQERRTRLEDARAVLKREFIGIDLQIDQILNSFQNWYLMPESLQRPIIINLWGMTGTGKTAVIRRLIQLLDLESSFAEVDMGTQTKDDTNNNGNGAPSYINQNLSLVGRPSVWYFDELQKARTINEMGAEVPRPLLTAYWAMLSDGTVKVQNQVDGYLETLNKNPQFVVLAIIEYLKLAFDLDDDPKDLLEQAKEAPQSLYARLMSLRPGLPQQLSFRFRQTVIFNAANIDEAFPGVGSMDEDQISVESIYKMSLRVTVSKILTSLKRRFRAEQIARLGNVHVVFPAFSPEAYRGLIQKHLRIFEASFREATGTTLEFDKSVEDHLYREGIVPSQGSRPLLSSIDQIIVSNNPLWQLAVLEPDTAPRKVRISISADKKRLILASPGRTKRVYFEVDISQISHKTNLAPHAEPFRTRVARHEAGHAVVGIALHLRLPDLVKSRTNMPDAGGLVRFPGTLDPDKQYFLDSLAMFLGGRAAEQLHYGEEGISAGAVGDLSMATDLSTDMVTKYGFGFHLGQSYISMSKPNNLTSFQQTDHTDAERILQDQYARAIQVLEKQRALWDAVSERLREVTSISRREMMELVREHYVDETGNEIATILDQTMMDESGSGFCSDLLSGE